MNDAAGRPVLRARGLCKHYGRGEGLVRAVDRVDLDVAAGETVAAVNAIFITQATVQDTRHASALTRALGATPQQLTAGVTLAQVLRAGGRHPRHPRGLRPVRGRQPRRHRQPAARRVADRRGDGTMLVTAALTSIPARIGARRPAAQILRSDIG